MKPDDNDLEFEPIGDYTPLIREGIYSVVYTRYEQKFLFGSYKLFVWFKIITPGEFIGVELYKAYNFSKKLSIKSLLVKDLQTIIKRRFSKKEKPKISIFKNNVLKVKIRTVHKDFKQRELVECNKYSVIGEIMEIEAGVNA